MELLIQFPLWVGLRHSGTDLRTSSFGQNRTLRKEAKQADRLIPFTHIGYLLVILVIKITLPNFLAYPIYTGKHRACRNTHKPKVSHCNLSLPSRNIDRLKIIFACFRFFFPHVCFDIINISYSCNSLLRNKSGISNAIKSITDKCGKAGSKC